MKRESRLRAWFRHQPFAMIEADYYAMVEIVDRHAEGLRLSADQVRAAIADRRGAEAPRLENGVAIVPLHGPIMPRATLLTEVSGMTSLTSFLTQARAAAADPEVRAIVLDVDSPGGSAVGLAEAADALFALREAKPIVAVSHFMNGSAAYMLASQAHEVVGPTSSLTGSIGTFTEHWDESGAEAQAGVKPTLIRAGTYKAETHPHGPLSDAGHAELQGLVNGFYGQFVKAVARGRGTTAEAVRGGYGEGRTLLAAEALEARLIDRIDTFENTVRRLQTPQGRTAATRAMAETSAVRAAFELLEL